MKPAGAAMTTGKGARSGHFSKRSGTLFLYELRKIAETRFLPAFLLLFLLAGCYIAGNKPIFFQKGALDSLNDIAAAYGVKMGTGRSPIPKNIRRTGGGPGSPRRPYLFHVI